MDKSAVLMALSLLQGQGEKKQGKVIDALLKSFLPDGMNKT